MSKDNKQQITDNRKKTSFTLIELLVYVALIGIIIGSITSFAIWEIRINTKSKVTEEIIDNARRAMETITYEIKEAKNIIIPVSQFGSHPGQLSLETTKNTLPGEEITYIDFYIDNDDRLCLKRENQAPIPLTSDKVKITNLVFAHLAPPNAPPSIQIDLNVEYKSPAERPEYKASTHLISTASPRSY